ncbi:MAG: hypothetical protein HQK49_09455 [Oligoflexia bacterium]|nr:hypothetical protein [Oligoflexia bacterium]
MKRHLWRGQLIDDRELEQILFDSKRLKRERCELLERATKFKMEYLYSALDKMINRLMSVHEEKNKLIEYLLSSERFSKELAIETIEQMLDFCRSEKLKLKVAREFKLDWSTFDPFDFNVVENENKTFESYRPLGILTHVTPGNALSVGPLSVVEGLLTKNINILKASHLDGSFAKFFFQLLIDADESDTLKDFINVVDISSKEVEKMRTLFSISDGVVAWGGESSMEGVRSLVNPNTPILLFGPKISFAYFTEEATIGERGEKNISDLCDDIILMEQEACSSPQTVYVQVDESVAADSSADDLREKIDNFARKIAEKMEEKGQVAKSIYPLKNEIGEITLVSELHRLESILGLGRVFESKKYDFRILVDYSEELKSSPLFRTIWVKPITLNGIISTLSSKRNYLQTVAVAASRSNWSEVVSRLYCAGVTRITPMGKMLESYMGEPHDGQYTLPRLVKRVSLTLTNSLNEALADSKAKNLNAIIGGPVSSVSSVKNNGQGTLTKEQFQQMSASVESKYRELYFRSGGSSGEPKFSYFTYDDYHRQMSAAADGLLALGLNSEKDLVMNLFYAGGLYGGFLSFFTILEKLRVKQLPMAAFDNLQIVADTIVKFKVNVLMGMPSYIISLFQNNEEFFKKNVGVVEKIYYGGEHFNQKLQVYFKEHFGIKVIKSATYGSVDAGPLGFQCKFLEGGAHHLHSSLHQMEILKMESDMPVSGSGEVGRLVFTSKVRSGQNILRYEIGDLGRYVGVSDNDCPCPCGRHDPIFELLGRYGDIFKAGGTFLNYQKFLNILYDHFDFKGEMQILLEVGHGLDVVRICINEWNASVVTVTQMKKTILEKYQELGEIYGEGIVEVIVEHREQKEMIKTAGSGKLKGVVDLRISGGEKR